MTARIPSCPVMSALETKQLRVLKYRILLIFVLTGRFLCFLQGNIQRSQLVVEQLGDSRKSMVKVGLVVMFLFG